MIETTLTVIETLLKSDGVSPATIKTVKSVIESDGLVTTAQACKTLGLSRYTIRRYCMRHGIKRQSRNGRQGSLVNLVELEKYCR